MLKWVSYTDFPSFNTIKVYKNGQKTVNKTEPSHGLTKKVRFGLVNQFLLAAFVNRICWPFLFTTFTLQVWFGHFVSPICEGEISKTRPLKLVILNIFAFNSFGWTTDILCHTYALVDEELKWCKHTILGNFLYPRRLVM